MCESNKEFSATTKKGSVRVFAEKPTWQILVRFRWQCVAILRLSSWGNVRLGKHSRNSYFVSKNETNRLTKQSNG